jgi:hypothetical protein
VGTGQADRRQRRAGSAQRWLNAALACTFFVAPEVPHCRGPAGGQTRRRWRGIQRHRNDELAPGALVSHPNLPVRPRLLWHAFDVLVLKQFVRPAGRRLAIDLIHFPS